MANRLIATIRRRIKPRFYAYIKINNILPEKTKFKSPYQEFIGHVSIFMDKVLKMNPKFKDDKVVHCIALIIKSAYGRSMKKAREASLNPKAINDYSKK